MTRDLGKHNFATVLNCFYERLQKYRNACKTKNPKCQAVFLLDLNL